ncbi:MAG: PAS domain-containing protein [Anaerolineales bacterium]
MNSKHHKRKAPPEHATQELCTILFNQSPDGVFIADSEQRLMDVNPAGAAMLGYTRDEILHLSLGELISLKEGRYGDPLNLETGKLLKVKCHLRHKSGKQLPLGIEAEKLSDGNSLVIAESISKRRTQQVPVNLKNLEEIVDRSPAIAFHWRAA